MPLVQPHVHSFFRSYDMQVGTAPDSLHVRGGFAANNGPRRDSWDPGLQCDVSVKVEMSDFRLPDKGAAVQNNIIRRINRIAVEQVTGLIYHHGFFECCTTGTRIARLRFYSGAIVGKMRR